jgi:hypothetical protein
MASNMVLGQIETEVNVLSAHIATENPSLDFIIIHAKSILQLAEGLVQTPVEYLDSERDAALVRAYRQQVDLARHHAL